jgi:hypothetical protein
MFASLIYQMLLEIVRRMAEQVRRDIAPGTTPTTPASWPPSLKALAEAYWDILYIYRFGLPKIPVGELEGPSPFQSQPQTEPSPMSGSFVRDFMLLDVLEHAMGDPHPQPDSFITLLGNKQMRITSARNLRDHLKKAIPQLEAEVKRLEKLK